MVGKVVHSLIPGFDLGNSFLCILASIKSIDDLSAIGLIINFIERILAGHSFLFSLAPVGPGTQMTNLGQQPCDLVY